MAEDGVGYPHERLAKALSFLPHALLRIAGRVWPHALRPEAQEYWGGRYDVDVWIRARTLKVERR